MKLVWPSLEYLPSYVDALEREWSPDNVRGQVAAQEELARIGADANAFLASLVDREAAGAPITFARRHERLAASWLSSVDVGSGILRQHRVSRARGVGHGYGK